MVVVMKNIYYLLECTSEISVNLHQTTWFYIPEDDIHHYVSCM
jgi:hypothetical protein